MGVTSTDTCYEKGLRLAELSDSSIRYLEKIIPPYVTAKNPVDLTFDQTPEQVADIINISARDEDVSSIVIIIQAELTDRYISCISRLNLQGKPLRVSIPAGNFAIESVIKMEELSFPVYDAPETAVNMLAKMYWFYKQNHS